MTPSPIVIFDLDHTLIRSRGMNEAFYAAAAQFGADAQQARAQWVGSRGRPIADTARLLLADESPDTHAAFEDAFWAYFGAGDPVALPGAEYALRELHGAGATLYLSTGTRQAIMERWLDRLCWRDYFAVVCGSEPGHLKGADHYATHIAHSGLDAAQFAARAASVGDGPFDMRFAVEHGVARRVGYLSPVHGGAREAQALMDAGANLLLDDLALLPELIASRDADADDRFAPAHHLAGAAV